MPHVDLKEIDFNVFELMKLKNNDLNYKFSQRNEKLSMSFSKEKKNFNFSLSFERRNSMNIENQNYNM